MPTPNPFISGLRCKCPRCGIGSVFSGFLTIRPTCAHCSFDLAKSDPGDGPVVFILLIVGSIGCFGLLFTEMTFHPPAWMELAFWLPMMAVLSLAALRPFKATMIALQFTNAASQASNDDGRND